MIAESLLTLAAIGTVGTKVGKKLLDAACYGIKRFLEPYFIAHENKVLAKNELEIFRTNPLKQVEFAQKFMANADGEYPLETVAELKNIWSVIQAAVNNTTETVVEEVVYSKEEDKEWYARFFDEARYISDEELQIVWGRLLAERMMHPAGVNNRALYFIRDLDKTEIETIRRSMRVFLNNEFAPDGVINDLVGMDYDIPVLLSLGIIYRSGDVTHHLVTCFDLGEDNIIEGNGYDFKIIPSGNEKGVEVQCYGLTPEGKVLSRLCESKLSRDEAQKICAHLNACWTGKATVELVEK